MLSMNILDILKGTGWLYIQKAYSHSQHTLFPHAHFGTVKIKIFNAEHKRSQERQ